MLARTEGHTSNTKPCHWTRFWPPSIHLQSPQLLPQGCLNIISLLYSRSSQWVFPKISTSKFCFCSSFSVIPSTYFIFWQFVLCVLYRILYNIDGRMMNWQGFEETRRNSVELLFLNFPELRKTMEIQSEGTMIKIQTGYLQNTSIEDQRYDLLASSSPVQYNLS